MCDYSTSLRFPIYVCSINDFLGIWQDGFLGGERLPQPIIENPLKTERDSGLFRIIEKTAQKSIYRFFPF